MAFRLTRPAHLVDINGVEALRRLAVEGERLCIGACVRHSAFHRPVVDGPLGKLLSTVVRHIAHHPIRTRGTFCGSVAHADPASEWCTVAAALDAEIVAQSVRGRRVIPAREFFAGIMTTALAEDELLTEVRLPLLAPDTRFGFYEFNRRAGDFALAMALAVYRVETGRIAEPRLAVGGAEPHARRIADAEQALAGRAPTAESFAEAAELAAAAVDPMEDAQTTAEYRRDLVRTVARRALERSLA
jgi:carbon-monoxide dehydrogenase medium subunit